MKISPIIFRCLCAIEEINPRLLVATDPSVWGSFKISFDYLLSGADPGFFLGGGVLVSCSTSTPINHIVSFFFCRISVVLENHRSSQRVVRTPCTLPLDPPLPIEYAFVLSSPSARGRIGQWAANQSLRNQPDGF